jgi:hypothetical protein
MLSSALQAMHEHVGREGQSGRVAELKRAFESRTGAFGPDDPWFDARSAAFLDDALCSQGLARTLSTELSTEHRVYVTPLERAHRGLFRVRKEGAEFLLQDAWSGAEFSIAVTDPGLRDALSSAEGFVDGRVVGVAEPIEIALMPGALFHSADATPAISALLPVARTRALSTTTLLDALLRMDHSLRALSRVKAAFAYRIEALPKGNA